MKFFFLSLLAVLLVSTARADEIQSYSGTIGGARCSLVMIWKNTQGLSSVSGILNFQGRKIPLRGENPKPGVLAFFDGDADVYRLEKTLTPRAIIWSGLMNGSVAVSFARDR